MTSLRTKIQVFLTIVSVALAALIGLYVFGFFAPHHASSSTQTKDILLMSCNELDLQINYYYQQSLGMAKSDSALSIAYNRQANTLLSIYRDQNCFDNQTQG